jgi:hypothetical protein
MTDYKLLILKAGDRDRTGDVQLGKLAVVESPILGVQPLQLRNDLFGFSRLRARLPISKARKISNRFRSLDVRHRGFEMNFGI